MALISINNLAKSFGSHVVLKDINFEIDTNDVVCLIGPSGSGKSTILRCINMLETYDEGNIVVLGQNLNDIKDINKFREKVGMVFQQFNLFSNLSVIDNCTIALRKVLKMSKADAEKIAKENLNKVGLLDYINVYPNTLSGGQKQRVAIARALCMKPEILLFDEPTSALDPEAIGEVLKVMKDLASEGMTMLIVTHEMGFVQNVANKVVFIDEGVVVETGTPTDIFKKSKNERIKNFISKINKNI